MGSETLNFAIPSVPRVLLTKYKAQLSLFGHRSSSCVNTKTWNRGYHTLLNWASSRRPTHSKFESDFYNRAKFVHSCSLWRVTVEQKYYWRNLLKHWGLNENKLFRNVHPKFQDQIRFVNNQNVISLQKCWYVSEQLKHINLEEELNNLGFHLFNLRQ